MQNSVELVNINLAVLYLLNHKVIDTLIRLHREEEKAQSLLLLNVIDSKLAFTNRLL